MNVERLKKGLWWDRAWKLVEGCTKVSAGCDHCWSEAETNMRSNHPNEKIRQRAQAVTIQTPWGGPASFDGSIFCREDNLKLPLHTKKTTVWAVWNDMFHPDVPDDHIDRAYAVMNYCQQHAFLVLTKRPERMANYHFPISGNIWSGTTVEDQQAADERIPHLLKVPGKRFLSIEPILGPVDLVPFLFVPDPHGAPPDLIPSRAIDAVLLGGESGPNARPMHPDWVRSVRDQCAAAGVPFFFKQWGEWVPSNGEKNRGEFHGFRDGTLLENVGKRAAGRMLDGCFHDDLPWHVEGR